MLYLNYITANVIRFFRYLVHSLLYFGIMHVYNSIGGVSLSLLEMAGPHVVHPVNEVHLDN